MHNKITRRSMVKSALIAGALVPTFGVMGSASAAALPPVDPNDPTAKALGYTTEASKVDPSANPTFKPNQKCSSCAQYQGKATDPSAPCTIFAGHSVPAKAWCKVWAQKPA